MSASARQFDTTHAVLWQLLCTDNASATDNAPSELFLGIIKSLDQAKVLFL